MTDVRHMQGNRPSPGSSPVGLPGTYISMNHATDHPDIGLLLSGGVDSAVLLGQLLARGNRVVPFYVRTGCIWEASELAAVERFLLELKQPRLSQLVVFDLPVADLYGDHWSLSGRGVPNERTPDEAVYLPGHNPLILLKPAIWCQMHGVEQLALATLSNNPFADATPEFFRRFKAMLQESMRNRMEVVRPFEQLTKNQVLEMGRDLPLELTFSCLAPVSGLHCGHCNKCAERRRAFMEVGMVDRTEYVG